MPSIESSFPHHITIKAIHIPLKNPSTLGKPELRSKKISIGNFKAALENVGT